MKRFQIKVEVGAHLLQILERTRVLEKEREREKEWRRVEVITIAVMKVLISAIQEEEGVEVSISQEDLKNC